MLLVEDDPESRLVAERVLGKAGMPYAVATGGEQALAMLSQRRPDVILMDLSMPNIDGWEITRRVRRDPGLAATSIIAVTAHAMTGDRERAMLAGCDDYVTKPYRPADLLAAIERVRTWVGAGGVR